MKFDHFTSSSLIIDFSAIIKGKPRDEFAPLHVALHENVSLTGSIVALLQASTSSYEEISAVKP